MNIDIIDKLEIINIKKYNTKFFKQIINKVKNCSELIFDRLDCSRFNRVDIIKDECKVEYSGKGFMFHHHMVNVLYLMMEFIILNIIGFTKMDSVILNIETIMNVNIIWVKM